MRKIDSFRALTRYVCRGCGTEIMYPTKYVRCPVCGIKGGW